MPKLDKFFAPTLLLFFFIALIGMIWLLCRKKSYKTPHIDRKNITQKFKRLLDETRSETQVDTPEIIIDDFKMKHAIKDKNKSWALHAAKGKIYKASNRIECDAASCTLKSKNKTIARLNSQTSILYKNDHLFVLSGNVNGHFNDLSLWGNDISYNFSHQTIQTHNVTTYSYKNINLEVNKSLIDVNKNTIYMEGVKTKITQPGNQQRHK